jgi:cyanophycinase-like exopeptidase
MLAPAGETGDAPPFDLAARRHWLAAPAALVERAYDRLALPPAAGPLILAGGLADDLPGNPVIAQFVQLSGGAQARILVVAAGYASPDEARLAGERYAAALGAPADVLAISAEQTGEINAPGGFSGILFAANDAAALEGVIGRLDFIQQSWRSGIPLLADGAAAAALGAFYANSPLPAEDEAAQSAARQAVLDGRVALREGLRFVDVLVEPGLLARPRWGRLIALAYAHPDRLAMGLAEGAALQITPSGARLLGRNGLFVLDLSQAMLTLGSNQAYAFANGLMDVFAPGELVTAFDADSAAAPTRAPTPEQAIPTVTLIPSATPTLTRTPAPPTPTPSRTPRPSATPLAIPPPANPGSINLMIGFGMVALVVILIGLLINYRSLSN